MSLVWLTIATHPQLPLTGNSYTIVEKNTSMKHVFYAPNHDVLDPKISLRSGVFGNCVKSKRLQQNGVTRPTGTSGNHNISR